MHTALNKTLAALPDDTRVYVSRPKVEARLGRLIKTARPRVHEAECQVSDEHPSNGASEEDGIFRCEQQGDAGQIYNRR